MEKSIEGFCKKIQYEHLIERVINMTHSFDSHANVKKVLSQYRSEILQKWRAAQRNHKRFLSANKKWLQSEIRFQCFDIPIPSHSKSVRGRLTISFDNSSKSSKRRKTTTLRQNHEYNELF